jgi:hypothetical protein
MNPDFEERFRLKMEFIRYTLARISRRNDRSAEIIRRLGGRIDPPSIRRAKEARRKKQALAALKKAMRNYVRAPAPSAKAAPWAPSEADMAAMREEFEAWLERRNRKRGY